MSYFAERRIAMESIEHLTEETFDAALSRAGRTGGRAMNTSTRWPLERVLFALAGTVTLLSTALAVAVSKWFLLLTAFVGVNQWLYVLVGACPSSILLRRVCGFRSAIYENAVGSRVDPKEVGIR
jgi:hypothetical protein